MRSLFTCAAAVILFASPAPAQDPVRPLLQRLKSIDLAKASEADCTSKVDAAAKLNAMDLFHGTVLCHAVKKFVEGNFLLVAGQIRAMADMGLMEAASQADQNGPVGLYGLLFFHLGGPGRADVLRDASATARFFELFDAWAPRLEPDYDPGWKVRKKPAAAAYHAALAEWKAHRRNQLTAVVRAFADEEYYALDRQFEELRRRTGTFVEGSAEAKQADELQRRMDERAKALGIDFSGR